MAGGVGEPHGSGSRFTTWQTGRPEGTSRNAAVERREARRPDRKGRETPRKRLDSQARHGCLASAPRLSALHSPSLARKSEEKGERKIKDYGAAGAAKQPAGGAMRGCLKIWLAQPDFLIEGRVGGGDPLAPRHAEDSGGVTVRNPC